MCNVTLIQIDENGDTVQTQDYDRKVMPRVPVVGEMFSWYGFIYNAEVVKVHYFYAPEDNKLLSDSLTITVRLK